MQLAYKWQAAIVTAVALFMAILDNTVVNVALPQMQSAFHTTSTTITWVVTAYFLAQAAVIPVTGYLSDLIGTKSVFMAALTLFTVGSLLCALAGSEQQLIAFRVFQGIGGGALFPIVFAIIFRVFPPAERGGASAIVGVPVLLAPAFGPTIGGYLTTTFNWNAIFFVNVPIGIVTLIAAFFILHGRAAENEAAGMTAVTPKRFDIQGLILAMVGFTALVYGISEAGVHGWNNAPFDHFQLGGLMIDASVMTYLIVAGVVLAVFVVNELLVSDPVLDLRLFTNYTFTSANVLMWGVAAFLFGSLILLPFFFERVRGETALSTGEIVISQGLAAVVTTIIAGRFYNRIGPRVMAVIGFALITLGTYGLTNFDVNTNGQDIQISLILRGLGLGLTNIPLQTLALSAISNRAMARASSLVNVTRQVAGAVGIATLTTYLAQQTTSHVASAKDAFTAGPLAQAQAACVAQFGRNVQAIQACVGTYAQQHAPTYVFNHAFTQGLNETFLLTTFATGVCVVLALVVGRDPNLGRAKQVGATATAGDGGTTGNAEERRPVLIGE